MKFPEFTDNDSFHVVYDIDLLESVDTEFGVIEVGHNSLFGNVLFFNGEIQITSYDFQKYHKLMLDSISFNLNSSYKRRVLVIGDGDGGFTGLKNNQNLDLVYIERCQHMMDMGTKYFGANWDNIKVLNQDANAITELTRTELGGSFDLILFAVTDCFNRNGIAPAIDRLIENGIAKSGTEIVTQMGCNWDSSFKSIVDNYKLVENRFVSFRYFSDYIETFFSVENFFWGRI